MRTSALVPTGTRGRTQAALTDLYISDSKIGRRQLSSACYTRHETLQLVAAHQWKRGEAERARVMLKAGRITVRRFLRERFGIVSGAQEYWRRPRWTPDRADLHEFLAVLRKAKKRVDWY